MSATTQSFRLVALFLLVRYGCLAYAPPASSAAPARGIAVTSLHKKSAHCQGFLRHYYFHAINNNKLTTTSRAARRRRRSYDHEWDGDDLRFVSRARRRITRSMGYSSYHQPAQKLVILLNTAMFIYQMINTIQWIARRYPEYWPSQAFTITWDTLKGSSTTGPLTRDFLNVPRLSQRQPHRYLTAGFLHGNILHFLLNMDALRRVPAWVETGLGRPLYLTTFLVSVVTGNLVHSFLSLNGSSGITTTVAAPCLGASGGICGLYGLMFTALVKMGNGRAASSVIKGMGLVLLYGLLLDNVSNAAHFGGFLGGLAVGLLCGPRYTRNYAARRKWSLQVDNQPRDYQVAMGFGNKPTKRGLIPLTVLWMFIVGALFLAGDRRYQDIPKTIVQGLLRPGSLTTFGFLNKY